MKQYLQGIGCISVLIIAIAIIAYAVRSLISEEALAGLITGLLMIGAVSIGYIYKRWNSPLIFAKDGRGFVRVFQFTCGVGTVLGPIKLALAGFPVPNVIPLVNLLFIFLCVPLAGLSVFGPMLIGSVFYKKEPTWLK